MTRTARLDRQHRTAGRGGRVLRGLPALLLLAALVAGVPWALTRYVGWPLPQRLPTWDELELHLFGPLSSTLLVDVLACACWLAWAAFTADVARCTAVARRRGVGQLRVPARGRFSPTHALAALLVGAVVLSILGNRGPGRDVRSVAALPAAAAPVVAGPAGSPFGVLVPVAHAVPTHAVPTQSATDAARSGTGAARAVVVRAADPVTGVHDSLWRIANRTLGSGARWPEIFAVNEGKPQPGGGTFTRPSLIYPGEELALPPGAATTAPIPDAARPAAPRPPVPADPVPPGPSIPSTATPTPPPTPPPSRAPAIIDDPPGTWRREPASVWDPTAFAGLGLAAAVTAALVVARRRRRRGYRPGSGRRDDLPAAPVVYQLRLDHLRTDEPDPDPDPDPDDPDLDEPGRIDDVDPGAAMHATTATGTGPGRAPTAHPEATGAGRAHDDAQRIALAVANTRGLGLTGPGGPDALRALLLTLLAGPIDRRPDAQQHGRAVRILMPRNDLTEALGVTPDLPSLDVYDTIDDALDVLEAESLTRAHSATPEHDRPVIVLVTRAPVEPARLQGVLDNGSVFAITALLLGQWRAGGTIHVQRDGTVTATGPGPCAALRGRRLLVLDLDAADDIMNLLRDTTSVPTPADRDHGRAEAASVRAEPGGAVSEREMEVGPTPTDNLIDRTPAGSPEPAVTPLDPPNSDGRPPPPPPQAAARPIRIAILGPPRILWRPRHSDGTDRSGEQEITGRLQPRARELLVHLALHPDGATRDAVAAALWPDSPPERTTNALNTALTRFRRTLAQITGDEVGDIIDNRDGRLTLDSDLVEVDYWCFDAAVTARRGAGTEQERLAADQFVVDTYGGELAEGTPYAWIDIAREAVRRDAIDSAAALARALVPHDPQRTLDLLEIARAFDPDNEMIYRDIMRLQSRLGRPDAISRTLALLAARLAETDGQPNPDTVDLARRLQRRTPVHHDTDLDQDAASRDATDEEEGDVGGPVPGGTARAS